jgi:hypothetical protein
MRRSRYRGANRRIVLLRWRCAISLKESTLLETLLECLACPSPGKRSALVPVRKG